VGFDACQKVNRKILALALPAIVANITTPLLGLVDTAIVGHMGSAVFIAAIALGGGVFSLLYWCFVFLRMGTSGLTAQAHGGGDRSLEALMLYRSLSLATAAGMAIIALWPVAGVPVLRFMGAEGATETLARRYVAVAMWGAPAVLATYALSGWFLGMQDSRSGALISVLVNCVNVAVSPVLVFGLGWSVEGVATGTVVAQWAGLATGVAITARRYRPAFPGWRRVMAFGGMGRFFRVNVDIFLRTLCLVAVTMWFTRASAAQGVLTLAVNTLLMQFFLLFSYVMDGFAFAGEALAGLYVGAGDKPGLRRSASALLGWGAVLAAVFAVAYAAGGGWALGMLTSRREVVELAQSYLWWAVAVPLAGFAAFAWDGVYVGATRTGGMLLSVALAMVVFFTLYACLIAPLGNHALWMAFVGYLATRGVAQTVLARRLFT
jgi:MATE family multidrug resistance protein